MNKEDNNNIVGYSEPFFKIMLIFPLMVLLFFIFAFSFEISAGFEIQKLHYRNAGFQEISLGNSPNSQIKYNILSEEDVSVGLKDTVYTDKDCWLELRIDQQMLYQHWRDGRVEKYPISSGNKYLSRSIESRPGLFAIFHKTERHESSQYVGAEMYHFMPFNQGIGFHSLNGTGYYGNLGVRPSSHGCIRMRHDDVRKVFRECPLGTLVLAHNGFTARVVGFAPEDYSDTVDYSKDEAKYYLAENLYNVLNGNYFVSERKYFVINPKYIPVSGVYIGYDAKLPDRQKIQKSYYTFVSPGDRTVSVKKREILDSVKSAEFLEEFFVNEEELEINNTQQISDFSSAELIKKYFHNPVGILPYFPPEQ
ncbi:MAG: L,D-transpeptidase [Ignavibacteria bacterium]|nr:L,D-transpeptidase [Ignavibacteria bacterium]